MTMKIHILVNGLVQGVYFRYNTMKIAGSLGLGGWVRNLDDGRVEVVAEGDESSLQRLIDWCRKGPPGAYVEAVEDRWEAYSGEFKTFDIRY
jgi:acylphosphatase